MAFQIDINTNRDPIKIQLEPGQTLFVLGPNGSGKSSLIQKIKTTFGTSARRISAHRQTWFESGVTSLSASDKKNTSTHISNYDSSPVSRYKDAYGGSRPNVALFDLLDSENLRARRIAAAVDAGDLPQAESLSKSPSPRATINELLRLSNLPITISLQSGDEVTASRAGSSAYNVAQLSDGERNALLIAAEVLTVPAGTLLLIDEPERHLHRSIISPLLTNLFQKRADCAFVVSTHDFELCTDNPDAHALLMRDCAYAGEVVAAWDADYVPIQQALDEAVRTSIIGARRKVIFVEGMPDQSLDRSLYALIFPNTTVVASSSCRDVEHAVAGIRNSNDIHWLKAWGIVDNDHRTADDIKKLRENGVHALDFFSVESIYFHPEIQHRVALRQAAVDGGDAMARIKTAKDEAMMAIQQHIARLAERVAEKELREIMMKSLPTRPMIKEGKPIEVQLNVAEAVKAEYDRLSKFLNDGDLLSAISHYPVRETPALDKIASHLGFKNRSQYQGAVLKILNDDQDTLKFVRALFTGLIAEIDAS